MLTLFAHVAGRHVGAGVHPAHRQDAHGRRLSDHHHVRLPERLRRRLVLGRHSAGLLLVSRSRARARRSAPMAASAIWRRASSRCSCRIAIAAWGLAGSYFAWFTFLLIGTAHLCLAGARRLLSSSSAQQGVDADESRRSRAEKGQELFPNERGLAGGDHRGRRPAHLGPGRALFRLLRRLPGADGLVPDLLDQPPPYGREMRRHARRRSASRCSPRSCACSAACCPSASAASAPRSSLSPAC